MSKAYFSSLSTNTGNPLAAADFSTVNDLDAATTGSAIVYNSANGKLFYNGTLSFRLK